MTQNLVFTNYELGNVRSGQMSGQQTVVEMMSFREALFWRIGCIVTDDSSLDHLLKVSLLQDVGVLAQNFFEVLKEWMSRSLGAGVGECRVDRKGATAVVQQQQRKALQSVAQHSNGLLPRILVIWGDRGDPHLFHTDSPTLSHMDQYLILSCSPSIYISWWLGRISRPSGDCSAFFYFKTGLLST